MAFPGKYILYTEFKKIDDSSFRIFSEQFDYEVDCGNIEYKSADKIFYDNEDIKEYINKFNIKEFKRLSKVYRIILSDLKLMPDSTKLKKQSIIISDYISAFNYWFRNNNVIVPHSLLDSFHMSDENSSATLNNINYKLTDHQGAIIRALYNAYLNSIPLIAGKELLHNAGNELLSGDDYIESDKISDIFKSNKSARVALIVKEGKSHYRLNISK